MFFDEVEAIEDRTEEVDYPPSEVEDYDDSSCEDEDEDEEQQESGGGGVVPPPAPPAAPAPAPYTGGERRLLVKIEPTPVAYFLHFVDDTFLAAICENTNRQAAVDGGEGFVPLDLDELKVFLGIVLHAGNGVRSLFHDEMFMPRFYRLFAMAMTEDRFLEILRRLEFSPAPAAELTSLAALGNIVEYFNGKMEATYCPGRDLCIHNSVVIWRGCLLCRERVARHLEGKHGVAVDALTDPTGVALRLRVSPQALELESAGAALGARVVDGLMCGLLDRGHTLYLDPFYCSGTVARRLLARRTYCTGLLAAEHRPRLEPGDGLVLAPWKRYAYLTTEFGEPRAGAGAGGSRTPAAVAAYMRATRRDWREDELRASPGAELRLRWPKQVFLLALHLMARNACALYGRYSGDSMPFAQFLATVTVALLPVDMDDLSDDDARAGDVPDPDDSRQL